MRENSQLPSLFPVGFVELAIQDPPRFGCLLSCFSVIKHGNGLWFPFCKGIPRTRTIFHSKLLVCWIFYIFFPFPKPMIGTMTSTPFIGCRLKPRFAEVRLRLASCGVAGQLDCSAMPLLQYLWLFEAWAWRKHEKTRRTQSLKNWWYLVMVCWKIRHV
jgi:hypothetical protein